MTDFMGDSEVKPTSVTISVTAETNVGGRPYMEDFLAVELKANEESQKSPHLKAQAYIGVFDGHGGKEAAKYARDRLWDVIQRQPKFQLKDPEGIKEALCEGYLALHQEMEPLRASWKRHKTGELSTAGTTASTVIFRGDHIFVANVGDSTAVLAVCNQDRDQEGQHPVKALCLTKDHKPEDPNEINNIRTLGGSVKKGKMGIARVVWERERLQSKGVFDGIPFLGVSRSLGDFWSFNPRTRKFTVSPKPDVYVHKLNLKEHKFVVIASDGLWNVMAPDEVVQFIWDYQNNLPVDDTDNGQPKDVVKAIIDRALQKWARKLHPADNIAVLIAFLSESAAGFATKTNHLKGKDPVVVAVDGGGLTDKDCEDNFNDTVSDVSGVKPNAGSPGSAINNSAFDSTKEVDNGASNHRLRKRASTPPVEDMPGSVEEEVQYRPPRFRLSRRQTTEEVRPEVPNGDLNEQEKRPRRFRLTKHQTTEEVHPEVSTEVKEPEERPQQFRLGKRRTTEDVCPAVPALKRFCPTNVMDKVNIEAEENIGNVLKPDSGVIPSVVVENGDPDHEQGEMVGTPPVKHLPTSIESMESEDGSQSFRLGKRNSTEGADPGVPMLKRFKAIYCPNGAVDKVGKETGRKVEGSEVMEQDSGVHCDDPTGLEDTPSSDVVMAADGGDAVAS